MKASKSILAIENLIIVVIIGIIGFSCQPEISLSIDRPTPISPEPTKQVISISLPLVQRWKWSGLVHNSFGPPIVTISQEYIIVATNAVFGSKKVVLFDARMGNISWESEPISNLESLDADDKRVYVGTIRYVRAYDLETGQMLWEGAKQSPSKRGGLEVYSEDDYLQVYDPYNSHLYLLDFQTGQIVEEIQQSHLFFEKDSIYYSGTCGTATNIKCLNAVDKVSGKSIWSYSFEGSIYKWPVFIGDTMFVNAGGRLFAIKAETGKIVWQSTGADFVTTVARGNDLLYAIRDDAAIVGFEPETGKQVGLIEIAPNQNLEYTGGYVPYYTIAASDKFVVVYYSNSQELIVFEKVQ
jgi:outer membrane protein assembly factor BamB